MNRKTTKIKSPKKLLLMRHAKADSPPGGADFNRPLTKKGEKDAEWIGAFLGSKKVIPDMIVASRAKRTLDTAKIVAQNLGVQELKIVRDATLYSAKADDVLNFIADLDEEIHTVLIVGHNPGFENCASALCGDGRIEMPAASLACFESDEGQWRGFRENSVLKFFISPKLVIKNINRTGGIT